MNRWTMRQDFAMNVVLAFAPVAIAIIALAQHAGVLA